MNPRIQALKQLLAADPNNGFARYGLAMEHVKAGELTEAVAVFEELLSSDPSYSAAYYHGGQTLEKLGNFDGAREAYRRGLQHTRDAHARSELQAALDILGE